MVAFAVQKKSQTKDFTRTFTVGCPRLAETYFFIRLLFYENRSIPPFGRKYAIGKAADVFARDLRDGKIGQYRRRTYVRTARATEIAVHMIERQGVDVADTVIECQRGVPVRITRFAVLVRLLAAAALLVIVPIPVVVAGRRVDIMRNIMVVVGRYEQVEPFGKQIAFDILQ